MGQYVQILPSYQILRSWPILQLLLLLFVLLHSSLSRPCQSHGTRETVCRTAPRENAHALPRSHPSSAAQTSLCTSTTDTPRTVLKARNVTRLPPMLRRKSLQTCCRRRGL